MTIRTRFMLAFCGALVACSTPTAPPAVEIALNDLPYAAKRAYCTSDPSVSGNGVIDCFDFTTQWFEAPLRQRIALVEAGALRYDGAMAAACLAHMTTDTAWASYLTLTSYLSEGVGWDPVAPQCQRVFQGDKPLGAKCDDDAQCATGRCWGCPIAVCTEPLPIGAHCGRQAPCASGSLCYQGSCQAYAPLPEGATCTMVVGGHFAEYNDLALTAMDCGSGLRCLASNNGAGRCAKAAALGQPCHQDAECADELVCGTSELCTEATTTSATCGTAICSNTELCALPGPTCEGIRFIGESCEGKLNCVASACRKDSGRCEPFGNCSAACAGDECKLNGACKFPLLGQPCVAECADSNAVWKIGCVEGTCHRTDNPACSWKE